MSGVRMGVRWELSRNTEGALERLKRLGAEEDRKGTTYGFTCETMKWFTLNISARLAIGRSLSTHLSIQRSCMWFQGECSPVAGFLARRCAEKRKGMEQEAATADQISTLGLVM